MKHLSSSMIWRTSTGACLFAASLFACNSGVELASQERETLAVGPTEDTASHLGGDTAGAAAFGGELSGTAGLDGPAAVGLKGWRSKDGKGGEIGLEQSLAGDFTDAVRNLVGFDPFRLATVAGDIAITRGLAPALQKKLAAGTEGDVIALVMPALPAQMAVEQRLVDMGAKVLGMNSPRTYVVKAPQTVLSSMSQELVYWIGQVPWDRKINPELAKHVGLTAGVADLSRIEAGQAVIALYDGEDADAVQQAIEDLGVKVNDYDARIRVFYVSGIDAAAVRTLARLDQVSFVDAKHLHHVTLETSVDRSGNHDYIRDTWTYGANIVLGLIDSGFEIDHDAFIGWSPYPALYARGWNVSGEGSTWDDNPSGHGTHVAGIMLSRWLGQDLDGLAPRSGGDASHRFRVVRTGKDTGSPTTIYNANQAMDTLASDNGAEIINNSWSSNDDSGTNSSSVKADSIVWDNGQIYVFAAGNDGTAAGSIDSPGAAKNVIAVGSVNNSSTLPLSSYSSQGPTADNRTKPDIYAVGGSVTSADADNLSGSVTWNGTSMATPHVSGYLATLLEHYNSFMRRPAMAKAYLMATAARQSGLPARTGTLNSHSSHFSIGNSAGKWGWRDSDPRPYAYTYWDVTIPSGVSEMFIVLTWIEPESAIGSGSAVFNDVDLWVDYNKDAGGFGEWGSTSVADNVEFVKIVNPAAGEYRINARNYNAPVIYKPAFGLFYH